MNIELIDRLIDWLEGGAHHTDLDGNLLEFDMSAWQVKTDCGTSCCLAGAAVQFGDPHFAEVRLRTTNGNDNSLYSGTRTRAQALLELTDRQADDLFAPWDRLGGFDHFVERHDLTPETAIHALTTLRDTGTPIWRTK